MTTPEKRADIAERFGWQEGEREALQREMIERAQRIARDETLRWCQERNEQKREQERAAEQPEQRDTEMSNTQQSWVDWVRAKIRTRQKAADKAMAETVGDAIGGRTRSLGRRRSPRNATPARKRKLKLPC